MGEIRVVKRKGGEGLPEGFLEVAKEVYAGDGSWVPEDGAKLEEVFSAGNPWFEVGEAVLLCVPGKARAAVFVGPTTMVEGEQAAFYGYFETLGEEGADEALFEEVKGFAREKGAKFLVGPINFSTYGTNRVRTRIEDDGVPFVGEPYTPLYYQEVLEGVGMRKVSPAVSQRSPNAVMRRLWMGFGEVIEKVEGQGFRFESMTPEVWLGNLKSLHGIIDVMFSENYAYSPLPYDVFCRMCDEAFVGRMDPKVSQVVYNPEGDIVGFQLVFPHYGPLMTAGAGAERVPVHELRYEEHFPLLKKYGKVGGIHKTLAVHPDYREGGVFRTMGCKALQAGDGIYDEWYAVLIREDNPSRKFAHGIAEDVRWYALFGMEL